MQLFQLFVGIRCVNKILGFIATMDKYGYELNHDLMKFINIFCTQMRIHDKLRNLMIAVIALCEHNVTATISIDNLQELLGNLSKNSTQKRISRTQLELLFAELTRQEYGLATSLIWYQFCNDSSTVLVRLDIMSSYDNVIEYAQNLGHFDTDRTRAIKDAIVKLFIPFELTIISKARQKPSFEALGKKLSKVTDLLVNFIDAGVDERINFEDIRTQLAEAMDSITSKGVALAKRLDALELQQELQQKQEQLLTPNKVENVEIQKEEFATKNNLEKVQKIVRSNYNSNENYNDENNNSKILNNNSSGNKGLTIGYIRDLETEAKRRIVNTVNAIYQSKNRRINSINSHYT